MSDHTNAGGVSLDTHGLSHAHDAIQTLATEESCSTNATAADAASLSKTASTTASAPILTEEGSTPCGISDAPQTDTAHRLLSPDLVIRDERWKHLLSVQREIEEESLAKGAERFRRRVEEAEKRGEASRVGAARYLLTHGIEPSEKAIQFFLTESSTRKGPKHIATKLLKKFSEHTVYLEDASAATSPASVEKPWRVIDELGKYVGRYKTEEEANGKKAEREALNPGAPVVAYMAIRAILDHVGRRPYLREVALRVSELLLDELRYRRFEQQAPGLFKYKLNSFTTSSYSHMARSMDAAMRYVNVDVSDLNLNTRDRLLVGTKLIDLVMQSTGLITTELQTTVTSRKRKGGIKREQLLMPTPETTAFMQKRNDILEFLSPVLMPMVIPPLQWEPGRRGGYRYALRNKTDLVRGSSEQTKHAERSEMPLVYQAVNAIQNTPWRINAKVYDLVLAIEAGGLPIGNLLPGALDPEPTKPEDIDTNEDARKQWRRKAHAVIEGNRVKTNRISEVNRVMTTAKRVKDFDAIFFPHNLDFRGRIYPVSHFLTPQGDDLQKGLLMFATGKPLGEMGATYLALHGMNCLDTTPQGEKVKRMTLDERVQWVMDHSADICGVANDPIGYRWWTEAEEPFQFYAFCVEWNGFLQLAKEGRGDEYVCALPVSIDGSCNGLQHFSAMLRDSVGAKAVNVFPNQRPEDVYDRISDKVKDKLELAAAAGESLAALWLATGLVDRKLTKRPTMTFSYGSKPYGFQQQLIEYLKEPDRWPSVKGFFAAQEGGKDTLQPACGLLADLIWESLQEVVVAAFQGMEWMQKVARQVSKTGKPIEWTVPLTGFHVRQEYYITSMKRINTVLAGKVVQPVFHEKTKEIQIHKQANAVSPNVVHSLDAAALMLSITQAAAEGVEHFAAIHDSYGTLAADMEIVWRAARQAFVHLYTNHDVVGDLRGQFQAQAPAGETVPEPPKAGTLDVASVLVSDYFFC